MNPDLDAIHRKFDAEEEAERGWGRFILHFVFFAFVPIGASGIGYLFGTDPWWFLASAVPQILVLGFAILIKELIETITVCRKCGARVQTLRKGLIDFIAIMSGFVVGTLGVTGWWV